MYPAAPPVLAYSYVDRATDTLDKPLTNGGFVPLTITGIQPLGGPPWLGLISLRSELHGDVTLGPGQSLNIPIDIYMSNCEFNGPGGWVGLDDVTVDYTIVGVPHSQNVAVGPYWFDSPQSCPRPRQV
jgi:hypothetical protein